MDDKYFEISFSLNVGGKEWEAEFRDVTQSNKIGSINGDIKREDGKKIFVVGNSELDDVYQGKGVGILMYEKIIKRALNFCDEFHSSVTLNDYSTGTWEALVRKYMNVVKKGKFYIVSKGKILGD